MIGAVVMAAGRSQRMGRPKMNLPWGATTVIGQVASVLVEAGVEDVVVVTGGDRADVESSLKNLPVRTVYNPDYANGEMTRTLQVGISALGDGVDAALVVLGDQPQIEQTVVEEVVAAFRQGNHLVVPSYQLRRGHPWLVARSLWHEVLTLQAPETLRDFLHQRKSEICYVKVDSPSVMQDLDTPDDYQRFRPT